MVNLWPLTKNEQVGATRLTCELHKQQDNFAGASMRERWVAVLTVFGFSLLFLWRCCVTLFSDFIFLFGGFLKQGFKEVILNPPVRQLILLHLLMQVQ